MTFEEIEAALDRALPMRPPRFAPGTSPSEKVSRLEDYMLEAAYAHADLVEAQHWLDLLVETLKEKVEQMTGWETMLPSSKGVGRATQQDINHAKARLDPATFSAGAKARVTRESVRRQIARFEYETGGGVTSRAYTLISGG